MKWPIVEPVPVVTDRTTVPNRTKGLIQTIGGRLSAAGARVASEALGVRP
jgi:hypothetical protein